MLALAGGLYTVVAEESTWFTGNMHVSCGTLERKRAAEANNMVKSFRDVCKICQCFCYCVSRFMASSLMCCTLAPPTGHVVQGNCGHHSLCPGALYVMLFIYFDHCTAVHCRQVYLLFNLVYCENGRNTVT